MNTRCTRAILFAVASILSTIPGSMVRAELVSAHIEGIVNFSPIATQNGEPWSLTLVFNPEAPEALFTAGNPSSAEYFNTGAVKALRLLDFSVGDSGAFTVHVVDPIPTKEFDVRLDVDNFEAKSLFAHVDDTTLLPAWNGFQLGDFLFGVEDLIPGGYFDGTDRLPAADPTITIAEFAGGFMQVRLKLLGAGTLIGTPTSFALAPVPEPSAGYFAVIAGLTVLLAGGRSRRQNSGEKARG